ncbi:MAG: choice-of-anchor Q domain-containing protein [Verrucomicrobiota bacterium]
MKTLRASGGNWRCLFNLGISLSIITYSALGAGVVSQPTEVALKAAVAGGGTVTFSFDGVISLTSPVLINSDTVIDGSGHTVQIYGRGSCRLAEISQGVSATFRKLDLYAGADRPQPGAQPAEDALGGAILNRAGNVTVEDCFFFGNLAVGFTPSSSETYSFLQNSSAYGGAIYSEGGSLQLIHSVFVQSRATGGSAGQLAQNGKSGSGGAVAVNGGTLAIQDCTFLSNEAVGGSPADTITTGGAGLGGALFIAGTTVQVNSSVFQNNTASAAVNSRMGDASCGGAIWSNGELHLTDVSVSSNKCVGFHAPAFGGGICSFGSLELNRSSIAHNLALGSAAAALDNSVYLNGFRAEGGGVYQSGPLTILNTSFLDNRAQGGMAPALIIIAASNSSGSGLGGGLYLENGTAEIAFTTFAMNKALAGAVSLPSQPVGAAFGDDLFNQTGQVNARDSIFGSAISVSVYGPFTDDGFNIGIDNSAPFTQPTSLSNTDPKFGTPTATYIPLAPGSQAIDTGDAANFPFIDQIWNSRLTGFGPDRGAIEFH